VSPEAWIFDPITQKSHRSDCTVWEKPHQAGPCTCVDSEDEMIEDFQAEKPYMRTPRVSVSGPQGPYQSLATMIRNARTAGLLKPVQGYMDHSAKAGVP
jgi:hypothetical protein